MKDKIKCLIEFVTFISIVFALLLTLGNIFTPKWTTKDSSGKEGFAHFIKGFYNLEPNTIDVMFIGNSSIMKGISPMQIYEDSGITSYDYTSSSSRVYMHYYFLKDVLKTQSPKVVFIDPVTFFYSRKEDEQFKRKAMDYMPLSVNKINMINDDIFELDFFEKASYVFPILRYHSRYNELTKIDIDLGSNKLYSVQKGFYISNKIKSHKKGFEYMKPNKSKIEIKDYNEKYLKEISSLCKENNIDLVILGMPDVRVWGYKHSIKMQEYATKYGFKYLDLNTPKTKIDWLKDTEDAGGHFNIKGAQKLTKYVTNYLKDNYDLPDHRNDPKYQSWNDDLVIYNERINELVD